MKEDEIQQNYKSSDANKHESKLSASATACLPKRIEKKYEGKDNTFNDNWIRPKKCMSTECFDTKSKMKEEHDVDINSNMLKDMNNNKFKALSCEDEKEEEK